MNHPGGGGGVNPRNSDRDKDCLSETLSTMNLYCPNSFSKDLYFFHLCIPIRCQETNFVYFIDKNFHLNTTISDRKKNTGAKISKENPHPDITVPDPHGTNY